MLCYSTYLYALLVHSGACPHYVFDLLIVKDNAITFNLINFATKLPIGMKKKSKEKSVNSLKTITKEWQGLWAELNATNKLLEVHYNNVLRVNQKIQAEPLMKQWEKLSKSAENFYDALEEASKELNAVEPIEIKLPWEDDKFKEEWENWKKYLKEQHDIRISSRVEQKQLDTLKKLSNGVEAAAFEMLDYSISNFYKMFFLLDPKREEKKTKSKNTKKDDDFS